MVKKVRLSGPTLKVLRALLDSPAEGLAGSAISKALKIGSGTLYPLLARLEAAGWCESTWEAVDPSEEGRPRRRFYTLTGAGRVRARAELAELNLPAEKGALAWN